MIFDFEYEIDKAQLQKNLNKLSNFNNKISNKNIIELIAEQIKLNIFTRTNAGYDYNYEKFDKYNNKYAKKEGKTLVNLTLTGHMLNAMTQKALTTDMAKIFFMTDRARKLAEIHNNLGAGKKKVIRKFFGINSRDEDIAQELYIKEITKAKKGVGL
jgi:hypothetical protein